MSNKETIKSLRPNEEGYQEWAEQVLDIVRARFGSYANFLKAKKIPESETKIPPAPDKKTDITKYTVWEAQMKTIIARRQQIIEQSPQVIGLIQSYLSEDSKTKLKEVKDYDTILASNDAIEFWKLIEKTHIGMETVNSEIQRILEELRLQMHQVNGQSLSSYADDCTKKIQRLTFMGCDFNEKKLAVQFLIGLERSTFSTIVGQWLSEKDAIPDSFQKTKEQTMNWYRGQVSANALLNTNRNNNSKGSNSSEHTTGEVANVMKDKVKCIYCKKTGHGAQTCPRLIAWLEKQQSKKNTSSANYAAYAALKHDFGDLGF